MSEIEEAITEHWGERCPDFEPECHTCRAWAEYDRLRAATQWRPIDAMTRSERLLAKRPTTVGWFSIDGKWTVASAWYRRHGEDERLRWVTDGGHWCVPDYYLPEPPPPVKPERAPLPPPPAINQEGAE